VKGSANQADRGLLSTLRELVHTDSAPPTSTTVAAAVGLPHEYTVFIERRLVENEERGYVERDTDGRWRLTPAGTAASGSRWATAGAERA
jgi:hypothetical protein